MNDGLLMKNREELKDSREIKGVHLSHSRYIFDALCLIMDSYPVSPVKIPPGGREAYLDKKAEDVNKREQKN